MAGEHPTIYDVAARAGVSIGTVSKALNASGKVSDQTRRRVLDAVQTLGFVPKEAAQARARRGSGRIGVFAPFSTYPSFGERLSGVLAALPPRRLDVAVFDVQSAADSGRVLETLPALRSLDGVIVMSVPVGRKAAAALRQGGLPAVFVDVPDSGFPSVTVDDQMGGRLAAGALLAAGKRRLAFLGQRQALGSLDSPSRRRLDGFAAALEAAGRRLPDTSIVLTGRSFAEAVATAEALLDRGDPPDGVFAHTDELAAAVHLAARRRGLAAPGDVAIIGFDDSTLAEALELTTIRQPLRESGQWALRTLVAMMDDPAAAAPSLTLPVELVRRRSA
ncbi:MAG: LacI family transcriptional regulator [Bifidobacteriaceae bacterium]|jgi:LacI family transcriptional regulator|nr:LacI family transcriptional regulator [Bifidobacteriaceae bacterium]